MGRGVGLDVVVGWGGVREGRDGVGMMDWRNGTLSLSFSVWRRCNMGRGRGGMTRCPLKRGLLV